MVEALLAGADGAGGGVDRRGGKLYSARRRRAAADLAVRRLLEVGARVDSIDGGDHTLRLGAFNGHEAVAERLVQAARGGPGDNDGVTPLCIAAGNGHDGRVMLLQRGATVDLAHNDVEDVAAHRRAPGPRRRRADAAAARRDGGPGGQRGDAAVHRRAEGHDAIVQMLLQRGATVDLTNKDQRSPLGIACAKGHAAVVSLLLGAGANVSHVDKWGDTPLAEATSNGHDSVAALLRAAGATA